MHRHITRFLTLTAILLGVALASCNRSEDSLLSTVPADSKLVSVNNFNLYFAQMDSVTLTRLQTMRPNPALDSSILLQKMKDALDDSHIVFFIYGSDDYMTATITDNTKLVQCLQDEGFSKTNESGFDIYSGTGSHKIAVRGDQLWTLSGSVSNLTAVLAAAKEQPITANAYDGLRQYLEGIEADETNRSIVPMKDLESLWAPLGSAYVAGTVTMESEVVGFDMELINAQGEDIDIPCFTDLSTDFLRYVPGNFNVAAAAGLKPGLNWGPIAGIIGMFMGPQMQGTAEAITPYLEKIDGTVSVAVGLPDQPVMSLDSNDQTKFIVMAHMNQQNVDEALAALVNSLSKYGIPVTRLNDHAWSMQTPFGFDLNVGNYDGYLTLANIPVNPDRQNALTETFLESELGLWINLTPAQLAGANLPEGAGFKVSMKMDDSVLKMKISLPGTDAKVLPTLIKAFL